MQMMILLLATMVGQPPVGQPKLVPPPVVAFPGGGGVVQGNCSPQSSLSINLIKVKNVDETGTIFTETELTVTEVREIEVDGKKGLFMTERKHTFTSGFATKDAKLFQGGKAVTRDVIKNLKAGDLVVVTTKLLTKEELGAFKDSMTIVQMPEPTGTCGTPVPPPPALPAKDNEKTESKK